MWRFLATLLPIILLLAVFAVPAHAARTADLSHMALRLSDLPTGFVVTSTLDLKNQPGGAEEYIAGFAPKRSGGGNSCMGIMCNSAHPGAGLTGVESDITLYPSATAARHAMPGYTVPVKLKITPVGQQYAIQYTHDAAEGTATLVLLFREGQIVATIQITGYGGATAGSIGYLAPVLNRFAALVDRRIKQAGAG